MYCCTNNIRMENDKLKKASIKLYMLLFQWHNILLDEKHYENILVYTISYLTDWW